MYPIIWRPDLQLSRLSSSALALLIASFFTNAKAVKTISLENIYKNETEFRDSIFIAYRRYNNFLNLKDEMKEKLANLINQSKKGEDSEIKKFSTSLREEANSIIDIFDSIHRHSKQRAKDKTLSVEEREIHEKNQKEALNAIKELDVYLDDINEMLTEPRLYSPPTSDNSANITNIADLASDGNSQEFFANNRTETHAISQTTEITSHDTSSSTKNENSAASVQQKSKTHRRRKNTARFFTEEENKEPEKPKTLAPFIKSIDNDIILQKMNILSNGNAAIRPEVEVNYYLKLINQARASSESAREMIDFVLSSDDFKIFITSEDHLARKLGMYSVALYSPPDNSIYLSYSFDAKKVFPQTKYLIGQEEPILRDAILHEFRHGYDRKLTSVGLSPLSTPKETPLYPFYPATLAEQQKLAIAIEEGDKRVLYFENLLNKERSTKLTDQEQRDLTKFKIAAESFQPTVLKNTIDKQDWDYILEKSHMTSEQARGKILDREMGPIKIVDVKNLPNNKVILFYRNVEKTRGFIELVKIKPQHLERYKQSSNYRHSDAEARLLEESSAYIEVFPPELREVCYSEREKYDREFREKCLQENAPLEINERTQTVSHAF